MKTHEIRLMIAGLMAVAASANAGAQLNSSVSVEGEYAPLVIETERLNVFPQGYRYELPAIGLDYEYSGIVTDFRPGLLTMGAVGGHKGAPYRKGRGHIDLRVGSWLNSRLMAEYDIIADPRQTLTASLGLETSTLYRMRGVPQEYTRLPRKRLYDGNIALDYSRILGEEGLLQTGVRYRGAYFNYFGTTVRRDLLSPASDGSIHIPTQTLNQVEGGISYESTPSFVNGWHAGAHVSYLSYRRLYSPVLDGKRSPGDKETDLHIDGGFIFGINEQSGVSIEADGHFLFYPSAAPEALGLGSYGRRNYGIVSLTPSYRLHSGAIKLQAGLDVAISYDAMGKAATERFSSVHLSPDVSFEFAKGGVGLFVCATGGVTPSTLLLKEEFDRYQMPWQLSTLPVYSPLDVKAGLNVGPFYGLSGGVAIRYASTKNTPLGGWYQSFLGTYLTRPFAFENRQYTDPYMQTVNLHGFNVALDLHYAYGTMLRLSFEGSYTPQKATTGIFNGFDRPRWLLAAKAEVRPIEKLKIEVGYDYRGVRRCYAYTPDGPAGYRLPDLTLLNARITYGLLKNLDLYCNGTNLLNRRVMLLPGLQDEGIVVSGGLEAWF